MFFLSPFVIVLFAAGEISGEKPITDPLVPLCDKTLSYAVNLHRSYATIPVTPRTSIKFTYKILPNTIPCSSIITSFYRSYCKASISATPGDSCTRTYFSYPDFTIKDVGEMLKKGLCGSFPPCAPGACYGETSSLCSSAIGTYYAPQRDFIYAGKQDPLWLHDSCVQDTKCLIRNITVKIAWGKDYEGVKVVLENGIVLENGFKVSGKKYLTENEIIYCEHEVIPEKGSVNATCFRGDKEYYCITQEDMALGYEKGFVFKMGFAANSWSDPNVLVTLPHNSTVEHHALMGDGLTKLEPVSMKDMERMVSMVSFSQLQQEYNALSLASALEKTQDVLLRLIDSIARRDPHLVPQILAINGISRRLNTESYLITPCFGEGNQIDDESFDEPVVLDKTTGVYSLDRNRGSSFLTPSNWFGVSKAIELFGKINLSRERSLMPKLSEALRFVRSEPQDFVEVTGISANGAWAAFKEVSDNATGGLWELVKSGFDKITVLISWISFLMWIAVLVVGILKSVL